MAVKISFSGKNYHGFQRQDNALSVQSVLEDALKKIVNEDVAVIGCSRTDTGVSAKEFVFNFHTESAVPVHKFTGALNFMLPPDIAASCACEVPQTFHSRYSCSGKEYSYTVRNVRGKDPFCEDRLTRYYVSRLDEALLDREAQAFLGKHDFSAFCSQGSSVKSFEREIYKASVKRQGDDVIFTFYGDGFLYNMVRIMVGTLIRINEGKIKEGTLFDIIESKDRALSGFTAEAQGLCLEKVFYKEAIFREGER